jgi:toxin ParE1/3/4
MDAAIEWYEREEPGVGIRFDNEVDQTYLKIHSNPKAWPKWHKNVRRIAVERFPYNVIYVERSTAIWIVAVAHAKRRPNYWVKRLKDIP